MDPLDEYNSEEDEDYVPANEADDQFDQLTGQQHGGTGQRGTKRKRPAGGLELSAPKRLPLSAKRGVKKKGPTRIGAAVLSEDEDEDLMQPPHLQNDENAEETPQPNAHKAGQQQQREEESKERSQSKAGREEEQEDKADDERKEDGLHAADSASAHTPPLAALATTPQHSTEPPVAAPVATPPTSNQSSPSSSPGLSSSPHSSTSTTAAPAAATAKQKGGDLASILAQFNKKPAANAKPAVKKVINPWEIPAKPKLSTPTPTAASSLTTPTTTATTAPSTTTTALSDERVVVTDITSYAGETLQITRTLIRGTPEELAHRTATQNNLTTLLASLTSQRAINTLDKSRLDWTVSKAEEGDEDELRRFVGSKDALVDRMAFLARAEQRQWEKVKEVREEGKRQTMTASTEGMDGS